jgi:hypothetical protein
LTTEPTFLVCVGATKSGTTWLHHHLRFHPDCHFRSIKELHYFDMTRPEQFSDALTRIGQQISELSAKLGSADAAERASLVQRLADLHDWQKVVVRGHINLDAYRAFLLGGRKDQRLVGDVTPSYAILDRAHLQQIADIAPGVKVLYVMRDPLARTWSQIRMAAARTGAGFEAVARDLLRRIVAGDRSHDCLGIIQRGDYRDNLPRLTAAFAPQSLHVEFYEDLLTERGLARLWAFLGIGPGPMRLDRRVWEGPKLAMTEAEAGALRRWLQPQYDFVSGLLPQLPQAWRMNMQERLA